MEFYKRNKSNINKSLLLVGSIIVFYFFILFESFLLKIVRIIVPSSIFSIIVVFIINWLTVRTIVNSVIFIGSSSIISRIIKKEISRAIMNDLNNKLRNFILHATKISEDENSNSINSTNKIPFKQENLIQAFNTLYNILSKQILYLNNLSKFSLRNKLKLYLKQFFDKNKFEEFYLLNDKEKYLKLKSSKTQLINDLEIISNFIWNSFIEPKFFSKINNFYYAEELTSYLNEGLLDCYNVSLLDDDSVIVKGYNLNYYKNKINYSDSNIVFLLCNPNAVCYEQYYIGNQNLNFLLDSGCHVCLFNYPGFTSKSSFSFPSYNKIKFQADRIVKSLKTQYKKVCVWGTSIGGIPASHVSGNCDFAIFDKNFSSIESLISNGFSNWLVPLYKCLLFESSETISVIQNNTKKIILCDHNDEVIHNLSSMKVGFANSRCNQLFKKPVLRQILSDAEYFNFINSIRKIIENQTSDNDQIICNRKKEKMKFGIYNYPFDNQNYLELKEYLEPLDSAFETLSNLKETSNKEFFINSFFNVLLIFGCYGGLYSLGDIIQIDDYTKNAIDKLKDLDLMLEKVLSQLEDFNSEDKINTLKFFSTGISKIINFFNDKHYTNSQEILLPIDTGHNGILRSNVYQFIKEQINLIKN